MSPALSSANQSTTLNATLVAGVRLPDDATRAYLRSGLVIASPLKLAIPSTAFTVVVPNSVPPLGFVPMVSVTGLRAVATRTPAASWISTCTAGEIVASIVVVVGCTVKASCTGPAGVVGPFSPPQPAVALVSASDRMHHACRAKDPPPLIIQA